MKNDLKGLVSLFKNEFISESGETLTLDNNLAWMLFVDINNWKSISHTNALGETTNYRGWDQYSSQGNEGPADMVNMYFAMIDTFSNLDAELDSKFLQDFVTKTYQLLSRNEFYFGSRHGSFPVLSTNFSKRGFYEYMERKAAGYYQKLGYSFALSFLDKKNSSEVEGVIEEHFREKKKYMASSDILTKDAVAKIVAHYNSKNNKAKTEDAKLEAIVEFVQNLEQMHPLCDKNCRIFCVLLFNLLLLRNGFGFTINFNPNRFDGYSVKELVELTKLGLERTKFLLANLKVKNTEDKAVYKVANAEEFERLFNCDNSLISAKEFEEIVNNPKAPCKLPVLLSGDEKLRTLPEILSEMAKRSTAKIGKYIVDYSREYTSVSLGKDNEDMKKKDFSPALIKLLGIVKTGIDVKVPGLIPHRYVGYSAMASTVLSACTALVTESYLSAGIIFIACNLAGLFVLSRNNSEAKVHIAV